MYASLPKSLKKVEQVANVCNTCTYGNIAVDIMRLWELKKGFVRELEELERSRILD